MSLCSTYSSILLSTIYSWANPTMKFVMDETQSVESITNFTLEESVNIFIMQLNNTLKGFDVFFWIVHSTSPPFRTVKCRGHWADHNYFQGSITRFDYGQFQMSTCFNGSWAFSCKIKINNRTERIINIYIFMDESNDKSSLWTRREASNLWRTSHWKSSWIFLSCNSTMH